MAVVFGCASSASAAEWSTPQPITPDVSTSDLAVGMVGNGTAVTAWTGPAGIDAAVAPPGKPFATPQRLSSHSVGGNEVSNLLAVDGRGDAIVAWIQPNRRQPSPGRLYVSYRPVGRAFGADHLIARNAAAVDVEIGAAGDATLVWQNADRPQGIAEVTRSAAGRFGRVQRLAGASGSHPALAVNARGDAVATWESGTQPRTAVQYATRRAGAAFARPITLVSAKQGGAQPAVGLDNAGTALVAWEGEFDSDGSGVPYDVIDTASAQAGSSRHGPILRLPTPGRGGLWDLGAVPDVNVDPGGDAVVVWETYNRSNGGRDGVEMARGRVGRALGMPQTVHFGTLNNGANSAIGPNGDAVVAWDDLFGPDGARIASGPQRPLGPVLAVSSPAEESDLPVVAVNRTGGAIAVWQDLGPVSNPSTKRPLTPLLYARAPAS
ncbi:MAG: hypothetical protein ACR2NR_10085 [Solirubrobacteraceae bacterium]